MRFLDFILLLNTLWFGAAFIQFSIAQGNTLKILVPREERGNPIAPTLSASVAFLGGINLPIGLLSFYLLAARPTFFQAIEAQVALFVFFAACHFSQFAYNLPVLMRGGRVGVAYWPVLRGPMLRIFVIDATLFVANLTVAVMLGSYGASARTHDHRRKLPCTPVVILSFPATIAAEYGPCVRRDVQRAAPVPLNLDRDQYVAFATLPQCVQTSWREAWHRFPARPTRWCGALRRPILRRR